MDWQDLPEKKNCFTVRSASMVDLNKRKVIRGYAANTRITVVQKCVTENGTFYRTESAKNNGLDWAFKASAFGLPDDIAPSVPSASPINNSVPKPHLSKPALKQKSSQHAILPNDGEVGPRRNWLRKLFRRKNG